MQVKVANLTSLSVDVLNAMNALQFHVGDIITFQTTEAVLEKVPSSVFTNSIFFHSDANVF